MPAIKRTPTILLIIASSLLVLFNVVALALFMGAGSAAPGSDALAGLTLVGLVVAWLGDLIALVLAIIGGIMGRARVVAILVAVAIVLLALASAAGFALSAFVTAVASMPVPIH